ncbi:TIGR03364 family FAD-dependent oxidoreductase [Burkholderia metallica]|uniref:TIGR03364 family FAD-dependent oxidoreductase n=1 Tax=Burkholderia metallica TaxID=488729 RepID=UPI001452CE03|nr:TIGR03364 family FAD-dependent oxidoreductase [Burkholderia metallica]VWB42141.1 FAD-dependent oxidoreductase [Burkholderia metallica]
MNAIAAADSHDVIVVGAGIVGLAHAYTAALKGLRVCVIERDAACTGASIRNFGFVTVTGQRAEHSWRRARGSREVWADIAPQAGIDVLHRGLHLIARRPEAMSVLDAFMQTGMADGCRVMTSGDAAAVAPELQLDGAHGVLHSPHELRIEPRTAIALLASWLAERFGVRFRYGEMVHEVRTPSVRTSRGVLHAERVIVCGNADSRHLYGDWFARHAVRLCQLQMLRVRPRRPLALRAAVMSDLSLLRYSGFAALPDAGALRARLNAEEPVCVGHGIHLIAVQSADGSLVVGDSHEYGAAPLPFAAQAIDAQILRLLHETLDVPELDVIERWTGSYPSAADADCVIDAPDDATRVVVVTSGAGMSTGFGIAQDVFAAW